MTTSSDTLEPPDLAEHDLEEVDSHIVLELEHCSVAAIEEQCTDENCGLEVHRMETLGNAPQTESALYGVSYELYESFFENPRGIGFMTIAALMPESFQSDEEYAVSQFFADAVELAVSDHEREQEKRTKEQVFDSLLGP